MSIYVLKRPLQLGDHLKSGVVPQNVLNHTTSSTSRAYPCLVSVTTSLRSRKGSKSVRCMRMTRQGKQTEIEDPQGSAKPESDGEPLAGAGGRSFAGALPKEEIQATKYLEKHPEYDGRNVVIAILDTGVDPGASGLQITTDGKRKIIDVVDCTGSGDVEMSKEVEVDENGCIEGLYGRPLELNDKWINPTGKWKVGAKRAYELFPGGLTRRIKEERKRGFEEEQRRAMTAATAALAAHKSQNGSSMPKEFMLKKEREELEARVKLLEDMMKKYDDLGPMIEAVVWHDGERWMAALDTADFYESVNKESSASTDYYEKGLLKNFEPLTNYKDCHRYGTFSPADACNFAINIYDEGKTLSIVVDAGSHGTHVAGIAAAYYPDTPELNGIAPGAQIVSCKIGDTRLGSMETNVGLARALITVLENKCDLINMSYGEAGAALNAGRFVRLAEEVVFKHNVIYVASAGNAGPALGTVGSPGGTSSALLGVGAFVTPALAEAGHSLRTALSEGAQYTWSSRGPAPDGDVGVNFSAPGGAIAPIPSWTASKMQLMNGTSMAAPCAAGGIALILSGLKALSQTITPARIRRAVENTALDKINKSDPAATLTHGRGLLQVHSAFEYMCRGAGSLFDSTLCDLRFEIFTRRTDSVTKYRGIYLREPMETQYPTAFSVEINPCLKEDADVQSLRLAVDLKISINSTVSWVKAPSLLMLHHGGRSIEVEVDPSELSDGVHYGEVQGLLVGEEWRGPIFRVPVTVIKPLQKDISSNSTKNKLKESTETDYGSGITPSDIRFGKVNFVPGREVRRFVAVPEGATWAELRIASLEGETPKHFMIRATSVLPHTRYSDCEYRSSVALPQHSLHFTSFAVREGSTLELTLAQFWSSLGNSSLQVDLSFHGIHVIAADRGGAAGGGSGGISGSAGGALLLDGNTDAPIKVFAKATLRREKIKPSAKLETLRIPVRPSEFELNPLSKPRDVLPGGRTIHRLVLIYKIKLAEDGAITPCVPLFNRFVYDSQIEAQMSFICDRNKKCLAVNDIYPSSVNLKKGDYTIRLMIRHEDPILLERFTSLSIILDKKLEAPLVLPIYSTAGEAIDPTGTDISGKERPLFPGEIIPMFVGPLSPDAKLPKDAAPGSLLLGSLSVGLKSNKNGAAPGLAQIACTVPMAKKTNDNPDSSSSEKSSKDTSLLLKEKIRDAKVNFLKSMELSKDDDRAMYEGLLKELENEWPCHLPVLQEVLSRLQSTKENVPNKNDHLHKIIRAADEILAAVDLVELAVFFARKCPEEGPDASERKKEAEDKKNAVVEALSAKIEALMDLKENEKQNSDLGDPMEDAYKMLCSWIDPSTDPNYVILMSRREERASRFASAIQALIKIQDCSEEESKIMKIKELMDLKVVLFEKLGWKHWAKAEKAKILNSFPLKWPTI